MKRHRSEGWIGWIDPEFDCPALHDILCQPEMLERRPGGQTILECHGRRIHRFELAEHRGRRWLGQYFQNPSLFRLWRRPTALRLLWTSQSLARAGLLAPRIIAAVRPRRSWWNRNSFAVIEEIPDVYQLQAEERHALPIHPSYPGSLEDLAKPIARTIANWHNRGVAHGDLKSRHVLLQMTVAADLKVFLIDIERTMILRGRLWREVYALRDLVQFLGSLGRHASEPFQQAFLQSYFEERRLSGRVQNWFERILRQYRDGRMQQGRTLLEHLTTRRRRNTAKHE